MTGICQIQRRLNTCSTISGSPISLIETMISRMQPGLDWRDTVDESVFSFSHELRYFWSAGDRWTGTTGLYYFQEDRDQLYGIRNRTNRVNEATPYSPLIQAITAWLPPCWNYKVATIGNAGGFGAYCGDDGKRLSLTNDNGAVYEHDNNVVTTNKAFYTQADYQISDTVYVTLGVRYSEDDRDALEARGGRSEILRRRWMGGSCSCGRYR